MLEFLTSVPGPAFAGIYAGWVASILLLAFLVKKYGIPGSASGQTKIPDSPDPYKLAYLREPPQTVGLAIVSLVDQGILEQDFMGCDVKISQPPPEKGLHVVEKLVLQKIGKRTVTASTLIHDSKLMSRIHLTFRKTASYFQKRHLISPEDERWTLLRVSAVILILLPGLFKIISAIDNGHTKIGILVVLMLAGMLGAYVITRRSRLTPEGKRFVQTLSTAFAFPRPETMDRQALLLALATGGTSVLKWADYPDLKPLFFAPLGTASSGDRHDCSGCGDCSDI